VNKTVSLIFLVAYFVVLPYLSRIGGGLDWVAQYLAPPDKLVFGLLFFGAFSAIPGVVLAALSRGNLPASRPALVAAFVAMSALTVFFHYDYDLASDAQAAIGLVVWPFYVTAGGLVVVAAVAAITWLCARLRG
jgi:hypothetical protein